MDNSLKKRVLLIDDEARVRASLKAVLEPIYETIQAADAQEGLELFRKEAPHLVLLDVILPGTDGLSVLQTMRAENRTAPVIMLTGTKSVKTAVDAMKFGAADYLSKPFDVEELRIIVERALNDQELQQEVKQLRAQVVRRYAFHNLIGKSPSMQDIYTKIEQVADSRTTVLIAGESGTGKELVAKALHYNSGRRERPFIALNCAALPETLIESELFGHEKGSFTDATARRVGQFELANTGTLFLDEIGDLSAMTQAKLLRVLQEREFTRVGGVQSIKVDVRIVTATNQNLEELVRKGQFREDLYYRINVIPIKLPPLRERTEDIPQLAEFFLRRYNTRFRKRVQGVTDSTMTLLKKYWWPGNIRELENLIERLVAMSDKEYISEEDLPLEFHFAQLEPQGERSGRLFEDATNTFERNFILRALEKCGGNVTGTAEYLGIPLSTLKYKMDKLDVRQLAKRLRGA